jgi:hypothetical protein
MKLNTMPILGFENKEYSFTPEDHYALKVRTYLKVAAMIPIISIIAGAIFIRNAKLSSNETNPSCNRALIIRGVFQMFLGPILTLADAIFTAIRCCKHDKPAIVNNIVVF